MMKKTLIISIAAVFIMSAFAAISAFSQEDVKQVRDSAFGVRTRGPVAFNHEAHNEKAGIDDCAVCHHVRDEKGQLVEGETSEDKECSECHMANGKTRDDLARAYHLNCKGCHEELKKGPVTCGECHAKLEK